MDSGGAYVKVGGFNLSFWVSGVPVVVVGLAGRVDVRFAGTAEGCTVAVWSFAGGEGLVVFAGTVSFEAFGFDFAEGGCMP